MENFGKQLKSVENDGEKMEKTMENDGQPWKTMEKPCNTMGNLRKGQRKDGKTKEHHEQKL